MDKRTKEQYQKDCESIWAAIELLFECHPKWIMSTDEIVQWCADLGVSGADRHTVRTVALIMVDRHRINIHLREGFHNHLFTGYDKQKWFARPKLG